MILKSKGSHGIIVQDNQDIDFGTGNFSFTMRRDKDGRNFIEFTDLMIKSCQIIFGKQT